MSKPLYTIESEKEIIEAARVMRKFGIKRLGVNYKNSLVGIISISDILAITPELFDIISEKAIRSAMEEPGEREKQEIDRPFMCEECTTPLLKSRHQMRQAEQRMWQVGSSPNCR